MTIFPLNIEKLAAADTIRIRLQKNMSHLFLEYFALLSSKDHKEFLKENGGLTQNFNGRTMNPIHFLVKKKEKNQTCIKGKLHKELRRFYRILHFRADEI